MSYHTFGMQLMPTTHTSGIMTGNCAVENHFYPFPRGAQWRVETKPVEELTEEVKDHPAYTVKQYAVPLKEGWWLNLRLCKMDLSKGKFVYYTTGSRQKAVSGFDENVYGELSKDPNDFVLCGSSWGLIFEAVTPNRKALLHKSLKDKFVIYTSAYAGDNQKFKGYFDKWDLKLVHESDYWTNRLHPEREKDTNQLFLVTV